MSKEPVELYLEYLDKENTILGVISTFCVLVAAFVLDKVFNAKDGYILLIKNNGFIFILVGSALMLFAAYLYFQQRSAIAWYQGQICLSLAKKNKKSLREMIKETDTRYAWKYHNGTIVIVVTAFLEYMLSIAVIELKNDFVLNNSVYVALILTLFPIVVVIWKNIEARILEEKFPEADSPMLEFLRHRFKGKNDFTEQR